MDIRPRTLTSYLMRFLISLLTMEVILHYMYMVAIKDTKAWRGDTPLELSMIGFWNLMIVWLKVGSLYNCVYPFQRHITPASSSVAILSTLVASQWDRSTREHGSMHGKQLLHARFLAKLAPFVQPMDSAVICFPIPSQRSLT